MRPHIPIRHRRPRRPWRALLAAAVLMLSAAPAAWSQTAPAPIVVFAAASLQTVLDAVLATWHASGGAPAVASYGASSTLARQIEQGAPADLFLSADEAWMDHLAERDLIQADSRVTLLGNSLVLVAPAAAAAATDPLASPAALTAALGADGRLAVAEVEGVPAGRYARAALTHLGLRDEVADRLAQADNVRAALAYVAHGEAPLGIVYATDAAAEPGVTVVATIPADSHPPIRYPAALTATAAPGAAALLAHLRGPQAAAQFRSHGFTLPTPSP